MMRVVIVSCVLMLATGSGFAATPGEVPATQPAPQFTPVLHPRTWSFPRDHGRHDGYRTEWWYYTGNLRDASGRRFGYQLTFFRTAYLPEATTRPSPWAMHELFFAHAAISDLQGKQFVFKDALSRGRPGLAQASDQTLDVTLVDWSVKLDAQGKMHLLARDGGLAIDLLCAGGRGPILEGPGGVNAKGLLPGEASYYYSMTRLQTTGSLTLDGKSFNVSGISWMDHEFSSNALGKTQVGWDWMGLSLANGDDLMIYRLRDEDASKDYLSGTLVTPDAQAHYLSPGDVKLTGSEPWKSEKTGGAYPQVWRLKVRGLAPLTIRSAMPGQELVTSGSTNVSYFEGACDVTDPSGKAIGDGYLEMTGYAKALGF